MCVRVNETAKNRRYCYPPDMTQKLYILSRAGAGYVNFNDVDLDWYWIYSLYITTTQITITSTENTLALVVPWILLVSSFFVHSLELNNQLLVWLTPLMVHN
jgi:hypothetical protein